MKKLGLLLASIVIGFSSFGQLNNSWTKKADYAGLKRERAVSFVIDSLGYVGTGVDTAEVVRKDFWKYSATLNTWTQVADLPGSVRRNAMAFATGGYGYVVGGIDSLSAAAPGHQKLNDNWRYDPVTNSWLQRSPIPTAGVYFGTGFAVDSKGYICCGKFGPNNYSNQLWEYKPSTDTWLQLAPFPGGVRYQLNSFSIGLKGYVGMGTDQDMYRKDLWEYDVVTGQWSPKQDLPASQRSAYMTFTIGQRGYVCMGANGGYLDDLWEYNPFTDDWTVRADYGGTSRKSGVGFAINGRGYVGLGKGYNGKKSSLHEYNPPAVVGTDELEMEFSIYPNPVSDKIKITSNSNKINRAIIYDMAGKQVTESFTPDYINVAHIPAGSYLITVVDDKNNNLGQKKFIKL
jgi:N-acetylneuraminic acid mutarotase